MVGTTSSKGEPVWVGVRLRPLSQTERKRRETEAWQAINSRSLKVSEKTERGGTSQAIFTYDAVFGPKSPSEAVYEKAARERVLSAMQGLNATVFVYGQTGSGKTYTMNQVVRLAASEIFDAIEATPTREFLLKLTAVEIYNEKVRDLLADRGDRQNLSLVEDPERGVVPEGCSDIGLESVDQLGQLLKRIESRRTVRDTRMNAESSRSHQIIRIYIESRPAEGQEDEDGEDLRPVRVSTINFVDLAGSERGSVGQESSSERVRQTEGSAINKSLLTLGNVIRVLEQGKIGGHVPYRDSKLTRMLQPSLGGNSRTAIICTLSPATGALEMSKAALHFANSAKRVTMQPVVNEVLNERARIRRLQSEIEVLREQLATKDFAEEAAQLSAALRQKEQEVKHTVVERDQVAKRLQNLERLILRSDKPLKDKRRSSWSELPRDEEPPSDRPGGAPLHMSWASPSSSTATTPPGQEGFQAKPQKQGGSRTGDRLMLDCLISPIVRQRATQQSDVWASIVDEGAATNRLPSPHSKEAAPLQLERIEDLQGSINSNEDERAAMEALRAEVRCIGRSGSTREQMSTTMGRLKAELNRLQDHIGGDPSAGQEETVAALQAEVARLEEAQSIQRAADTALDSLQDKLAVLKLSTESQEKQLGREKASGLPSWFSFGSMDDDVLPIQEAESALVEPEMLSNSQSATPDADEDEGPLMGSPSASPDRMAPRLEEEVTPFANLNRPQSSTGTPKIGHPAEADLSTSGTPEPTSAPNALWYKMQLRRMQMKFREAAAEDVGELKAALQQQRDQVARLECQKQLLLKQVLRTESRLDTAEKARQELQTKLTEQQKSIDAAAQRAEVANSAASVDSEGSEESAPQRRGILPSPAFGPAAPTIGANWRHSPPKVPLLKLRGDVTPQLLASNESWDGQATIESMLPGIVALWDSLHVPLIHRSRFYLAFRNREVFYFETEKRRLAWLQSEIGDPEDRDPFKAQRAKRALARSFRKLDWERKWLAQQVKWDFSPEEREEMFLAWNIHRDSKQRKLQLIKRLWSPETLTDQDGKERSSELVMRLNGAEATEGMFDMVFGRNQGESTMKTMLATGGSMLAKIATPLRASSSSSPAQGLVPRRKSFLSSITQTLTPRGRAAATTAESGTPLRHGSMAWTPRGALQGQP